MGLVKNTVIQTPLLFFMSRLLRCKDSISGKHVIPWIVVCLIYSKLKSIKRDITSTHIYPVCYINSTGHWGNCLWCQTSHGNLLFPTHLTLYNTTQLRQKQQKYIWQRFAKSILSMQVAPLKLSFGVKNSVGWCLCSTLGISDLEAKAIIDL